MSVQPKLKAILILSAIMIFAGNILLNAQSELGEKIKDIKGKAQKVTIKTDDGEFTFEGKDAEEILKNIKSNRNIAKYWVSKIAGDSTDFFSFSGDSDPGNDNIKMKIKYDKGEKTITVTTKDKDGKETIETYKGDEADEYLKNHSKFDGKFEWVKPEDNKNYALFFKKDKDDGKDMDISIWNMDDNSDDSYFFFNKDDDGIKKMIKISEEDGEKKLTVTSTDENGNKTTETYKGKEAEEYLEKNNIKVKIKKMGSDDGDTKEIIIRKKKSKKD